MEPAQPDYGDTLDYGGGVTVPRADTPPDPEPILLTYDEIPPWPEEERRAVRPTVAPSVA